MLSEGSRGTSRSDDESGGEMKQFITKDPTKRKMPSNSGSARARAFRQNDKTKGKRIEPGSLVTLKRSHSSTMAGVTSVAPMGVQGYVVGVIETLSGDCKVHVVFDGLGSSIMDTNDVRVVEGEPGPACTLTHHADEHEWHPANVNGNIAASLGLIFLGEVFVRHTPAGVEYKREWKYLNLLLFLVPPVFYTEYSHGHEVLTFVFSFLAIIPLAGMLGLFTEDLSVHVGSAMGALLNASFGNATEIIICVFAVQEGLFSVIKNSMLGSVMSNMLLVLGCSFLARSMPNGTEVRAKEMKSSVLWSFNPQSANVFASLLLLSTFCLAIPTAYAQLLAGASTTFHQAAEIELYGASRGTAIVMMISYTIFLAFQVRNTAVFMATQDGEDESAEEEEEAKFSWHGDIFGLGAITVLIAFVSEFLVGSLESATEKLGLSEAWVAVILIPIVGNAAEHVTAVIAAHSGKNGKGDMECAVGVAIGSSIQIAGFAVPLLVVISWFINGTHPNPVVRGGTEHPGALDMNFHPFSMTLMTLSVIIVNTVLTDGQGSWLEGVCLVACYTVIGVVFWFVPMDKTR